MDQGWILAQVCAELIYLGTNGKLQNARILDACFYGSGTTIGSLIFDCNFIGLQGDENTYNEHSATIMSLARWSQIEGYVKWFFMHLYLYLFCEFNINKIMMQLLFNYMADRVSYRCNFDKDAMTQGIKGQREHH